MFISLRIKIIFFISLLTAITAAGILYFTYRDVGRAMFEAEETLAQNVLRLVELNIKGGYDKLLSDKMEMIVGARKQIRSVAGVCLSVLEGNAELIEKGVLSRQEAQKRSLNWLKSVRFAKANVFVFDRNSLVIAHPDITMEGTSVTALRDMKGRLIAKEIRENQLRDSGDFAVFSWKTSPEESDSQKLGYFVSFPTWNWTVVVAMDMSAIETQSRQKKEKIIKVLENTFARIELAQTGFAFLFNGQEEILIPPRRRASGEANLIINARTGNFLLEDLMQAARSENNSMHYTETSAAGTQLIQAYVRYFKALDWYMVVAVPNEEIHAPANTLVARQSFIIGMIFLGSLIAAYFLLSRISRPLNLLAAYAKELPSHNFTDPYQEATSFDDIPVKVRDEVSRLSESFVFMEAELKKNIQEVLAAEVKYRAILESIEEGFFETDFEGKWMYYNESICKITGYSRYDLKNKNIREYITSKTLRKMNRIFNRVSRSGEYGELRDGELIRKDGAHRIIEMSIYPIRESSGQPAGFRGFIRDVSERLNAERENNRLEAQLVQAQKMEAMGTLAGGVAHDFSNILSAIFGYTELSLLDAPEGTDMNRQLNEILRASGRAKELVSQILAFSHHSQEELKPMEIQLTIKEVLKLLRASLPATIEIRQHLDSDGKLAEADSTQIHQLIMNLCTNAAAAMDADGGVIEVSFTSVDIKEPVTTQFLDLAPGSYLKLTVSDTGNGMTPEVMEKIFDPYFTTKEKGKGTGLGLAVVHGILKRHRAAITVEATPAKGSTFHVYFPRIKQAATPAEAGAAEPLPGGHECVLIVDDEEDLVNVETRLLSRLGYEVVSQNNSIEVLELFQAQPDRFDVVITDMTMPKMTGDKLAKEILKIRPDLPIILCTGYSEHLSEEQAKKIGIKEYCLKPVRMRDLARTMRKVLDQNQC